MAEIDYTMQIQVNFCYFLKNLDICNGLLDRMYSDGLMSSREVEFVKRMPTKIEKNEQFLMLILRHRAGSSLWKAMESSTNQNFIIMEAIDEAVKKKQIKLADITVDDEKLNKIKILQHLSRILSHVKPLDVLPYMFENGLITLTEYEGMSDRRASCKRLINVLHRKEVDACAFYRLKLVLKDRYEAVFSGRTDEQCVFRGDNVHLDTVKSVETDTIRSDVISPDVIRSDMISPDVIRSHFTYLLKNVEINGLLDYLFETFVIDRDEKESLDRQPCIELRVERLLLFLSKRSAYDAEKFLDSLRNTGQGFIANVCHSGVTDHISSSPEPDEASARKWVEENETLIIDRVDSFDVRPYLFEKGVISIAEYEEIMCCPSTCRPLINLLRDHEPKKDLPFSHLMRAMRDHHADFVDVINSTQFDNPYFDHPEFLHLVNLQVGVWGIAVLRNVLYVAMHNLSTIFKYSADEPFNFLGQVEVTDLRWPTDMAADDERGCLYISDRRYDVGQPTLFVLSVDDSHTVFPMDVTPGGLSLLGDGRIMVVCENNKRERCLRLYRLSPDELRVDPTFEEIRLQSERYVLQAAMIRESVDDPDRTRIVISQEHKSTNIHRIICVDGHGEELCYLGEKGSEYPRQLTSPWSVVMIDAVPDSGAVMLANDCDNHRVIIAHLIDDHIEYLIDLISAEDGEKAGVMFYPRRICWNPSRGILFVGSGYKSTKTELKSERAFEATKLDERPNASGNVTVWRVAQPRALAK